MRLLIHGADVLPGTAGLKGGPADILVEGERIAAISAQRLPEEGASRVLDGSGLLAVPGLVNCHNHVAMTLLRGYGADLPLQRWLEERIWPAEARLTDEDVHAGALLGCLEMLRGGVTAFADMYDHMDAVLEAVLTTGIRASLSRGVIGLGPSWEGALREGEELCRQVARTGRGRVSAMLAPHAEYTCPTEVWDAAVALARELGVPIHTHLSETAAEQRGCHERHGSSPVRFLAERGVLEVGLLAAHGVHLEPEDLALLARPGVAVAHNPVSNAKLGSGVAPLVALLEAGVLVGLGSDGAASTDTLGLWEELRLAGWLQKAILQDAAAVAAPSLWSLATVGGARALHLPEGTGLLVPGAPADLVLLRQDGLHRAPILDPWSSLVYTTRDADVVVTVVAGRPVMEHGEFPGIDHERIAADVSARARRLLEDR